MMSIIMVIFVTVMMHMVHDVRGATHPPRLPHAGPRGDPQDWAIRRGACALCKQTWLHGPSTGLPVKKGVIFSFQVSLQEGNDTTIYTESNDNPIIDRRIMII